LNLCHTRRSARHWSSPIEGHLAGFDGATGWLNSPPLTAAELQGRIVLVDFWTYTCINWLRTLPYVRAWQEKYTDRGVVVVGVHTPEFPFEHELDNVRQATGQMGVSYPVALDNDYRIWDAFGNHYWPALYIADADGRIRHHQFGEGGYRECERIIQQLLSESGRGEVADDLAAVSPGGFEAQADWPNLESPETYLGYAQAERFASPGGARLDDPREYTVPRALAVNEWALEGTWTVTPRASVMSRADGRIVFRFHARDVHLVLAAWHAGTPVPYRVLIDGKPPGDAHGLDVDEAGDGTVIESRLYQLIRQSGSITDRTAEVAFFDQGVEAYVFTFG
jgi:thiol-disulfide isomerase/thioredoxin